MLKKYFRILVNTCLMGTATLASAQSLSKAPKTPPGVGVNLGRFKLADAKTKVVQQNGFRTNSTLSTQSTCASIVTNGNFETQSAPISGFYSNVYIGSYPYTASDWELSDWKSTNASSPDYFASNAPANSYTNPASSFAGAFIPFNYVAGANNGSLGLITHYEPGLGSVYAEYVTQQLSSSLSSSKKYYATMQVYSASKAQYAAKIGLDITISNPSNYTIVNSYYSTPVTFQRQGCGIESSTVISAGQWATVSGIFSGIDGARWINIGNFQQSVVQQVNAAAANYFSYVYIDNVGVYEIPTAGSTPTTCGTAGNVTIGDGCDIPGATYAWTVAGSSTPFATTMQTTVSSSNTNTYTLTVTLPDGSTSVSTVTISPGPTPGFITGVNDYAAGRLTAQIDPMPGATSYNWYKDGILNTTRHGTGAIWIIPRNGCGGTTVSVEAVYACGKSAKRTQYFIAENCGTNARTAYPNPAAESLTVPQGIESATLLNSQGKQVLQRNGAGQLNLQMLPDGLYNLQMREQGKVTNQRVEVKH